MNDLEKFFYNNNDKLIDKWNHYFDIYDLYFNKYRGGKEIVILEIGVFQGGEAFKCGRSISAKMPKYMV